MIRRWIQLLLLASVVFWTTGSAAYLHELIEHAHAPLSAQAEQHHSKLSKPAKPAHSERDCPECASLAAMHIANVAPTIALTNSALCTRSAVIYESFLLSESSVSLPPPRGPPSKVLSLHSA
jgi:hypothetical protein